jgi:ABC-type oligopeptide transport system substrate-binding subunit
LARRTLLSIGLLFAGAVLLAAVLVRPAGGGSVAGEVRKGGTLRVARASDVDSIDPALALSAWGVMLVRATCATLFRYQTDATGTRVIPEVVDRWSLSRDRKTYTFELKKTLRFHTGDAVTAGSFADAFNRDADPKMHSAAVVYMHGIVGADAVIDGKATTISGVQVLGPYRLRIRLTKPLGDFTARLTMPFFCPLLPNMPIGPAGINDLAGSGPYHVAERIVNQRIVLKRNPLYRGGRPANVDQIVYTLVESADACRVAVEQDRIDICPQTVFSDAAYREIVARYGINREGGRFFVRPNLATWYFAFNHDRPAFNGPGQIPLKKAINYAIDRPALARAFGYLSGRRTDQMLPPALGRDASIYPLGGADPATARRWLKKAKFQPAKLVLYSGSGPIGVEVGQVFAFQLKQIGIEVEVKYFDQAALNLKAAIRGEPYDIVLYGWGADYPDPAGLMGALLSDLRPTDNLNVSYFDDAKTKARIAAADRLTGEARRKAWAELDIDLMRSNPPWAPFTHGVSRAFISKSYGCFHSELDLAPACKR